ncbi:hypothetical protein M8494_05400 [Serratia ureilytica]
MRFGFSNSPRMRVDGCHMVPVLSSDGPLGTLRLAHSGARAGECRRSPACVRICLGRAHRRSLPRRSCCGSS